MSGSKKRNIKQIFHTPQLDTVTSAAALRFSKSGR